MASEVTAQFNIDDAKENWLRIIERVESGEEIIIARAGHPVAIVVPPTGRVTRTARGSLRGGLVAAGDWDSPTANQAIADDFDQTP
jgi:prevent-host-death family protein